MSVKSAFCQNKFLGIQNLQLANRFVHTSRSRLCQKVTPAWFPGSATHFSQTRKSTPNLTPTWTSGISYTFNDASQGIRLFVSTLPPGSRKHDVIFAIIVAAHATTYA
jgi:hypothetical protein